MYFKRYWLNMVQFLVVLISAVMVRVKFLVDPSLFDLIVVIFVFLLYLSCIYEIPLKVGKKKGYTYNRIMAEIFLIWVIPLVGGYLFSIWARWK